MNMKWMKILVICMMSCLAFASCEKGDELKIENNYAEINRVEGYVASLDLYDLQYYVQFAVAIEGRFKAYEYEAYNDDEDADVYVCVRYGENADMSDSFSLEKRVSYIENENGDRTDDYTQSVRLETSAILDKGKKYYYQAYVQYYMPNSNEKFVVYDEVREFGLSDDRVAKNVSLSVTEKNNGNTVFFHVALSGDPLGLGSDMMEYLSPNDIEVVVKCGAEESLERTVVCYDYDEDDGYFWGYTEFNMNTMFCQPYVRIMGVEIAGEIKKVELCAVTDGSAIDLGLPSGIKWGSCNLGADSVSGFGGYYGWGKADGGWFNGTELPSDISGTEYDVARAMLGGSWQIPTKEQWEELVSNTRVSYFVYNGVSGLRIVGLNGNSIFLPKAGHEYSNGGYGSVGDSADYWSSVSDGYNTPYYCFVYFNYCEDYGASLGGIKYPIRPVCD
ncbi:MAG: hypothetical protein UHE62_06005 [Muribaculaceae bacterium]|nr:hypothetical protein [Muribaculaceae bacterium]